MAHNQYMTSRKNLPLTAEFAAADPAFAVEIVNAFLATPASVLAMAGGPDIQRGDLYEALLVTVTL